MIVEIASLLKSWGGDGFGELRADRSAKSPATAKTTVLVVYPLKR